MRVKTGKHAANSILEERFVLDRFDVIVLNLGENLGKGAQVLERQRRGLRVPLGENTVAHGEHRSQHEPDCKNENTAVGGRHLSNLPVAIASKSVANV